MQSNDSGGQCLCHSVFLKVLLCFVRFQADPWLKKGENYVKQ